MSGKDTVLIGVVGTGVVTFVGDVGKTGSLPSSRLGFGIFISLVLLLLLAEAAPDLAAGFATLMFLTALFATGVDVTNGKVTFPLWDTLTRDTTKSSQVSPAIAGAAIGAGAGTTLGAAAAGTQPNNIAAGAAPLGAFAVEGE